MVRVWDRRTLDDSKAKPVGILTGHTDGVTFVDSKVGKCLSTLLIFPISIFTLPSVLAPLTFSLMFFSTYSISSFQERKFSPFPPDHQGDGRYLISNGKDQALKLWDVRRFGNQDGMDQVRKAVNKSNWDYRWEPVPKRNMKRAKLNGDVSVMTYRGHGVLCTLIRYCSFLSCGCHGFFL